MDNFESFLKNSRFAESGYYDKIWPLILLRDKSKCVICGKRSNIVHHINNDRLNYKFTNLVVVCKQHHSHKHEMIKIFSEIAKARNGEMEQILRKNPWR